MSDQSPPAPPRVSVILATHDRPQFLPIILACYRHQTYPNRELIVVDDSDPPIDEGVVIAAGGRLLRNEPGTMLGDKLNHGVSHAGGALALKMDDDDWYAPDYMARMVSPLTSSWNGVTRRMMAAVMPLLFFDLARWEVRRNVPEQFSGATLIFTRADWERLPFRSMPSKVDTWFASDQVRAGVRMIAVAATESFLQVRHGSHVWTHQADGTPIDEHMLSCPLYVGGPEALLPEWALQSYREISYEL